MHFSGNPVETEGTDGNFRRIADFISLALLSKTLYEEYRVHTSSGCVRLLHRSAHQALQWISTDPVSPRWTVARLSRRSKHCLESLETCSIRIPTQLHGHIPPYIRIALILPLLHQTKLSSTAIERLWLARERINPLLAVRIPDSRGIRPVEW